MVGTSPPGSPCGAQAVPNVTKLAWERHHARGWPERHGGPEALGAARRPRRWRGRPADRRVPRGGRGEPTRARGAPAAAADLLLGGLRPRPGPGGPEGLLLGIGLRDLPRDPRRVLPGPDRPAGPPARRAGVPARPERARLALPVRPADAVAAPQRRRRLDRRGARSAGPAGRAGAGRLHARGRRDGRLPRPGARPRRRLRQGLAEGDHRPRLPRDEPPLGVGGAAPRRAEAAPADRVPPRGRPAAPDPR